MNPHYHPYGGPTELTSPHPPSPDNNNYHGGHTGGPPGPIRMHPANGHTIGSIGLPGGPHDQHPHNHHQHPAFTGGGPPSAGSPHHQQQQQPGIASNSNPGNGGGGNGGNNVKICAGCGGKIVERYLLHALDRYWHDGCLKCSCCAAMLADLGSSCFTKGGMILCKQDYMRLFGSSRLCSACGQLILASDYVLRSSGGSGAGAPGAPLLLFHAKCFMCSKCMTQLVQGDRYYMLAGSVVCEKDWHNLLKSSAATPVVRKGKVGRPRRSRD